MREIGSCIKKLIVHRNEFIYYVSQLWLQRYVVIVLKLVYNTTLCYLEELVIFFYVEVFEAMQILPVRGYTV